MSELNDIEARLAGALSRIRGGMDAIEAAHHAQLQNAAEEASAADASADLAQAQAQIDTLNAQLEEERAVNAQLEERVKRLKERQDGRLAELEQEVDSGQARSVRFDRDVQRLRQVNAELRSNNAKLREAVEAGVSEPNLVNKAMLAELESLRATRQADAAEMDAILDKLTPIIAKEADNAAG